MHHVSLVLAISWWRCIVVEKQSKKYILMKNAIILRAKYWYLYFVQFFAVSLLYIVCAQSVLGQSFATKTTFYYPVPGVNLDSKWPESVLTTTYNIDPLAGTLAVSGSGTIPALNFRTTETFTVKTTTPAFPYPPIITSHIYTLVQTFHTEATTFSFDFPASIPSFTSGAVYTITSQNKNLFNSTVLDFWTLYQDGISIQSSVNGGGTSSYYNQFSIDVTHYPKSVSGFLGTKVADEMSLFTVGQFLDINVSGTAQSLGLYFSSGGVTPQVALPEIKDMQLGVSCGLICFLLVRNQLFGRKDREGDTKRVV